MQTAYLKMGSFGSQSFDVHGMGEISANCLKNQNVEGKLTFFKKNQLSNLKGALSEMNAFIWVVYLIRNNNDKNQISSSLSPNVLSANLFKCPNQIGLSLLRIRKFETDALLFDCPKNYSIDQSIVLNIERYMPELHSIDCFKTDHDEKPSNIWSENISSSDNSDVSLALVNDLDVDTSINEFDRSLSEHSSDNECIEQTKIESIADCQIKSALVSDSRAVNINKQFSEKVPDEIRTYNLRSTTIVNTVEDMPETAFKEKKTYKCSKCHNTFKKLRLLIEHKRLVHKIHRCLQGEYKKYECDICKKTLSKRLNLENHIKQHIGITSSHQCFICGKLLATSGTLKMHMANHDIEKKFKCSVCGSSFAAKLYLNRHMKTHEDTKSFCCDICGNTYSTKACLFRHIRLHSGLRPYKCDICEKTFRDNRHLKQHSLTHTGEKPYACPLCDKTFNRTNYRLHHVQKSHPNYKHLLIRPASNKPCLLFTTNVSNLSEK